MNLIERLKWLRKNKGISSKSAAAAAMGIKYGTYQRYEYGGSPNRVKFKQISEFYHCSLSWLMTGEGEAYPKSTPLMVCENSSDYAQQQPELPPDDFVFIRQMRGKISAGGGLEPDNSIDMRIAFRKDWITRKGKPEGMSLIKVDGDSMAPTLLSGDLVLVDHSRTTIASQGGIYAISIDHEVLIKRLQLLYEAGKVLVISDNKQYPSQEISADKITVNGKVIWYARELER